MAASRGHFSGVRGCCFQKMGDRKPRAQRRAMATIKSEKFIDRPVAQHAFHPALEIIADPGRAQPLAFEAEKGDLIERVDRPQPQIEFEAVNDPDFVIEPNVLGTQVAMPLDDPPVANARRDKIAVPLRNRRCARSMRRTRPAGMPKRGSSRTRRL